MESQGSSSLNYEALSTITLANFYRHAVGIMADFRYSLHRTVLEVGSQRRIEIWQSQMSKGMSALVWIEIVHPEKDYDPYLATDVLRTMNDEEQTSLFFFTNTALKDEDIQVLDSDQNYVFTADEIITTLSTIEKRASVKLTRQRKMVKTPSANILIKNFLSQNRYLKKQIKIKTSSIPELTNQYVEYVSDILKVIDDIYYIDDIPNETREYLKKEQYNLLPEMLKIPNYCYIPKFAHLRNDIFGLIHHMILYIGNLVEYESEEELHNNRMIIDSYIEKLSSTGDNVLDYKLELMEKAEFFSMRLILYSLSIVVLSTAALIIVRKIL